MWQREEHAGVQDILALKRDASQTRSETVLMKNCSSGQPRGVRKKRHKACSSQLEDDETTRIVQLR